MPYGELYIPEEWSGRNAVTGCFLPGHVPHNKGRKLGDYMTKRAQRRSAKGWKNVVLHRSKTRPDNAGRSPKQIIAVEDDGTVSRILAGKPPVADLTRNQAGTTTFRNLVHGYTYTLKTVQ